MTEGPIDLGRLRALDPVMLSEAHRRHLPEIYRYLYYRTNDWARAEDLAGEVFLQLIEALNAGKGPRRNLRGWLYGTASNLVNGYYRKAVAREVELPNQELKAEDADPAGLAEQLERIHMVQAAFSRLTPEQQHVLGLRLGNGFSVKETASLLGKRPGAVRALQFRAINSLRQNLSDGKPSQ